jgi:hypothetical protein
MKIVFWWGTIREFYKENTTLALYLDLMYDYLIKNWEISE